MPKTYEIKNIDGGILDVDDKSRRVKAAYNKVNIKDHDGEIIEHTAYDKTIKERGPIGKNMIWHLTDHNPSLKNAVGKFKELRLENDYLVGVTDIPNTTWGNDVLEFYRTGTINQHSIGFSVPDGKAYTDQDTGVRIIKEVKLFEGSAVLWGANEWTPTLSVGKSLSREEIADEYSTTLQELNKLAKLFKSGHLSDESFELIEIKVSQLTDKLQHLFNLHTQPAHKAVEPQKLEDVFNNFINTLKTADYGRSTIESAT